MYRIERDESSQVGWETAASSVGVLSEGMHYAHCTCMVNIESSFGRITLVPCGRLHWSTARILGLAEI